MRREEENQDTGEGLASEEATGGKRQYITDGLTVSTNREETLFSVYSRWGIWVSLLTVGTGLGILELKDRPEE